MAVGSKVFVDLAGNVSFILARLEHDVPLGGALACYRG